jgi:hypothetical protein
MNAIGNLQSVLPFALRVFRNLIRELGVTAAIHVVPAQPVFPSRDELARVAGSHDLTPVGPPMSVEDVVMILATLH